METTGRSVVARAGEGDMDRQSTELLGRRTVLCDTVMVATCPTSVKTHKTVEHKDESYCKVWVLVNKNILLLLHQF